MDKLKSKEEIKNKNLCQKLFDYEGGWEKLYIVLSKL